MKIVKSKVITITSAKGGSGKSIFTLALAGNLFQREKKVLIIDLDLSSGVIATCLNLKGDNDIFNLTYDMMNGRFKNIDDYIRNYNKYIDIISSPIDPRTSSKIQVQYIEAMIKQLEYKYDYILIDTTHHLNSVNATAFDLSDSILYLITGDIMDLKNMKTLISIYDDMNVDNYKIIMRKNSYTNYEVETVLGRKIDYLLPKSYNEENIQKYLYEGKIFTIDKKIKELDMIIDNL